MMWADETMTVDQLRVSIAKRIGVFPQSKIDNVIKAFPNRLAMLVEAKGEHFEQKLV